MASPARMQRQLYKSLGIEQTKSNLIDKERRRDYNRNAFLNIVSQMFEYDGLPDTMSKAALEWILQNTGAATVWKVPEKYKPLGFGPQFEIPLSNRLDWTGGLFAFPVNFAEAPDPYGFPYQVVVTNPGFRPSISETLVINQDCIVVRNDTNMRGLYRLCDAYAEMLTEAEVSLMSTLVTLRDHITIVAKTERQRKAAEAYIAALQAGDYAPIYAPELGTPLEVIAHDGRSNAVELAVNGIQSIRYMFYNAIGINSLPNTKREYTSAQEIDEGKVTIQPQIDDMLHWREVGVKAVNELFGTNISVRKSSAWKDMERSTDLNEELLEAQIENLEEQSNRLDEEKEAGESELAVQPADTETGDGKSSD